MAYKIERIGNYIIVTDTTTGYITEYPARDVRYDSSGTSFFRVTTINDSSYSVEATVPNWIDKDDVPFTFDSFMYWLNNNTGSNFHLTSGALDVILQSPVSPIFIIPASRLIGEDELAVATAINDTSITVTDATGITVFDLITIYNATLNRVYFGTVLAINTNTLDLDTPLDTVFPIGSVVSFGDTNMNVDGSVTPVVYGIRNPTSTDLDIEVDFTRMIIHFETATSLDLSKFGDITGGLDNGLICRQKNGTYSNIFNVKTNGELSQLMYDFNIIQASGNQQDGATGRFTFEKLGSVVRLKPFEDLEFIVQDDLTTLNLLTITAQGAGVTN